MVTRYSIHRAALGADLRAALGVRWWTARWTGWRAGRWTGRWASRRVERRAARRTLWQRDSSQSDAKPGYSPISTECHIRRVDLRTSLRAGRLADLGADSGA